MTLQINEEVDGRRARVAPIGRLDSVTSHDLEVALGKHISREGCLLALDMSEVEYASSAGLRVLMMVAKRMAKVNGKVVIVAPQPSVMKVLVMSGFTGRIEVAETLEAGYASLAAFAAG